MLQLPVALHDALKGFGLLLEEFALLFPLHGAKYNSRDMNKQALWDRLAIEHERRAPASKAHFEKTRRFQVRGGSHNLRLFEPFPFYDRHSCGSKIIDLDGNQYVDFWQGHYANILGHNPPLITQALAGAFQQGKGLQTGFPGSLQAELAELVCKLTGAEQVRFTTSGALATLYAVMLSRGFTGRNLVLKIGGGWHGSQPYLLKGVTAYEEGLQQRESAGLHPGSVEEIVTTRFNHLEHLEETFRQLGEQLACFILEPFMGEGGFLFVDQAYLERARELTREYGTILIFDEIISGFRFCAGSLGRLYGVSPDLAAFGKILGGGMPLTALAGRADILELCDPNVGRQRRVRFEGGTFSAHPACVLAGLIMIRHLVEQENRIYPALHRLAEKFRRAAPEILRRAGIRCLSTGHPSGPVTGSSMAMMQFPLRDGVKMDSPEVIWNPEMCDVEMREKIFRLAMVTRGFHVVHGFGSVSAAHSEQEVDQFLNALDDLVDFIKATNGTG